MRNEPLIKLSIYSIIFYLLAISNQIFANSEDLSLLEKELTNRLSGSVHHKIKINRYLRNISCEQIESQPSKLQIKLNTHFDIDPFTTDPSRIQQVHGIEGNIYSPEQGDTVDFYRLLNQRQLIETVTMVHKYKKSLCEIKLTQKADNYVINQFTHKGLEFYKDFYVLSPMSFDIVNIYPHPEQVLEGSNTKIEYFYFGFLNELGKVVEDVASNHSSREKDNQYLSSTVNFIKSPNQLERWKIPLMRMPRIEEEYKIE